MAKHRHVPHYYKKKIKDVFYSSEDPDVRTLEKQKILQKRNKN